MSTPAQAVPLQQLTSAANDPLAIAFAIRQALLKMQTSIVVEVQAVHGGGLGPVGMVDVLPLVDQIDGAGNAVPHKTIYGCPYGRWQGGSNAIILDPQAGDLGICLFASRDISAVIASRAHGPPPSRRAYSFSDGMYVGGTLNLTPTSYLLWDEDGNITLNTPGTLTLNAGGKVITIDSSGITIDGILWETHAHLPGTYVAGSNAVTGEAGNPKNP